MEEESALPSVPISTIELRLIDYALFVYSVMAQHIQGQLPEDHTMLFTIKDLRQRISAVEVPEGGEQPFPLTVDELAVILHALTAFITSTTVLIPASQERDETILIYKELRSSLATIFAERSISSNEELYSLYKTGRIFMRRKRTPAAGSEPEGGQQIGHITTPIEDDDLERVKVILKRHAVSMHKIKSPDNWWTLFLPDGTTQIKKEMRDKATLYTICLPDGYCFLYQAPVFNYDKSYDTFPMIVVSDEEGQ